MPEDQYASRSALISEYYRDKTILITGTTGLLGKVLVEAILRVLPDVRRIYMLIRPRSDESGALRPVDRTMRAEIITSSAFDGLRNRHGSCFDQFIDQRIEAVAGDLAEPRLGMDGEVYRRLQREVDIIINSGALAVFDAPLDQAIQTNTLGPRRIIEFARGCHRQPFVAHVSTCYVNPRPGPVFETPLDPRQCPRLGPEATPFDVDTEVEAILSHVEQVRNGTPAGRSRLGAWLRRGADNGQAAGSHQVVPAGGNGHPPLRQGESAVEAQLVRDGLAWARRRGWNDTYTFTKAMGEQLFVRHQGAVPGLILRPSIIESSLNSPAPGWIDGFRMADPLIVGFGRHQLFEFPGNPEALLDLVPVDIVANALLAAIPWTHGGRGGPVYHVASGMENPLRLKEFHKYLVEYFTKSPLRRAGNGNGHGNGLPQLTFPEPARFLRDLDRRYLRPLRAAQWLLTPLKLVRWGGEKHASIISRRARLEKLRHTASIYGPYAACQARFLTYNTRAMWEGLSNAQRRQFPFQIRGLEWRDYVQQVHVPGIERYLLRMPRSMDRAPAVVAIADREAAEPARAQTAVAAARSTGVAVAVGRSSQWSSNGAIAVAADPPRFDAPTMPATEQLDDAPGAVRGGEGAAGDGEGGAAPLKWNKAQKLLSATGAEAVAEADVLTTPLHARLTQHISAWLMSRISKHRLNLRTDGLKHVPTRVPFIVASNHTSHVDTGVLLVALKPLGVQVHPTAAADYWFRSRLIRWVLRATLGAIPFARHCRNIPRALALPAAVLRGGHGLIFYPEGSRSPNGQMRPFKSTVGLLALAAGVPIVPAHISGAYQALPKGRRWIRHHPVHVQFGPPVSIEPYLDQLDRDSASHVAGALAREVQAAVARLAQCQVDAGAETQAVTAMPEPGFGGGAARGSNNGNGDARDR